MTPEQLEATLVRQPDGCWTWPLSGTRTGGGGYGQAKVDGRRVLVHRFMYERHVGPIPDGLTIDHLCGTKRCAEPTHLEPVTSRENSLRGGNLCAQRARQTHCLRGHELAGDNVYVTTIGSRQCRECVRINQRAREERRRVRAKLQLMDGQP